MKKFPLISVLSLILTGGASFFGFSATSAAAEHPRFSTDPELSPAFGWNRSDYAVRCAGKTTTVTVNAPEGWRAAVRGGNPRTGSFSVDLNLDPNRAFTVRFRKGTGAVTRFHVRCLPANFPEYRWTGSWKGGPRLVVAQMRDRYAAAFDRNGAPVWWFRVPEGSPNDAKLLADGTFSYAPVSGISFRRFHVRSLEGRSLRVIEAADGAGTDLHDLILLPNGNYLLGAHRLISGVNTARFGGAVNSTIDTAQLQEITPSGRLVWKWDAYPRIKLRETGRWWKTIGQWGSPYDIHHWNSIERKGRQIIVSFRHLDAVYMIDRRTGRIKWKLGGVKTKKNLRIRNDRFKRYPFGGQHDARFVPGGITVFDNATSLARQQPRGVRYRIEPRRRLATLVDEAKDPQVNVSVAMGSARLISNTWFIGWGAIGENGVIGGYSSGGTKFRLVTPKGFGYRMHPVPTAKPTIERLRRAMDRIAAQGS